MTRRADAFQTIHSEGGLLPPDLLRRLLEPKEKLPGTQPADYGLAPGERLNEVLTQSWNRLRRHWAAFREAAKNLAAGQPGDTLTNDRWNLPLLRELGFGVLPFHPGQEINGRLYPIHYQSGPTPIHLIGCGRSLDRRVSGVQGNPHGLVQELLNRSPDHLWAIVANGLRLRVLRDSQALSRQSYLEFDLEALFDGEVYADFVLLWRVVHATRFAPQDAGKPDRCWLEQWTKLANEQGARALGDLRQGVERALQTLGQGLVGHPRNTALREALRDGTLALNDLHGQLLRVVYRLIFLFVAEDRTLDGVSVLHPRSSSAIHEPPRPSGAPLLSQGGEKETASPLLSSSVKEAPPPLIPSLAKEGWREAPGWFDLARARYVAHYSTARLRQLAGTIKGSRHGDLWQQFNLLVGALSGEERFAAAREALALPALGSGLWNPASTADLNAARLTGATGVELSNADFLEALRHLAFTRQGNVLRPVDYQNLGAEELGGVYESLLALTPRIEGGGSRFTFAEFAGNERKTSGSYYTPDSLVQCLLDSALDPVVEAAIADKHGAEAEQALLALKVCDPAVGSGHFLVGAAHRLARHLARVRAEAEGDSEPSPLLYQTALREVIGRCLYGVDLNPMSAELCRVNLWLEALEPGKPLSFLDHHIRVGNSLLGAMPALIAQGIPDEAFKPITGDDPAFCREYKRQNQKERESRINDMFGHEPAPWERLGDLAAAMMELEALDNDTVAGIQAKQARYAELVQEAGYLHGQLLADAWCAAFVWKKRKEPNRPYPILDDLVRKIEQNPYHCPPWLREEIGRLARQYQFFHGHLAFPEVYARGGFDVMLGNPPWERVKLQEKEWFAERRPEIANAPNAAARKRLIEALKVGDPELYQQFQEDLRQAEGESHFLRNSGRYPLCGRGDINVYTVFAEGMRNQLNATGRMGCVLPSGIATDDTTKFYFQDVVERKSLVSLFDFENRLGLFPDVDSRMKFCLFTAGNGEQPTAEAAEFAFFAHGVADLRDPERRFTLSPQDIALLNPNTRTCPIFRSRRDAELTKAIYRRVPVLSDEAKYSEDSWGFSYREVIHMSHQAEALISISSMIDTNSELRLYEAKMIHHYDHRWLSFNKDNPERELSLDRDNPTALVTPRYYVKEKIVIDRIGSDWKRKWLIGWRDITNTTNERTMIFSVLPFEALSNTLPLALLVYNKPWLLPPILSSYAADYCVRQKMGGTHLTMNYLRQVAVLTPSTLNKSICIYSNKTVEDFIIPRVLELTYTAWDLEPFAQDCGFNGPPFRWDEARRFLLRCELDATFFHLYLGSADEWRQQPAALTDAFPTPRDAVAYIMDTFPIVKRKDEAAHGSYRTKDTILEIYDAMIEAMATGQPYQTRLDPPPADSRCCHPPR